MASIWIASEPRSTLNSEDTHTKISFRYLFPSLDFDLSHVRVLYSLWISFPRLEGVNNNTCLRGLLWRSNSYLRSAKGSAQPEQRSTLGKASDQQQWPTKRNFVGVAFSLLHKVNTEPVISHRSNETVSSLLNYNISCTLDQVDHSPEGIIEGCKVVLPFLQM